ncbi:MAG: hypothetical protein EBY81_04290 [Verrucomicrobia bacterium]|nr:hypothetical protein [Verrucomicrobiota bacterium]
MLRIVVVETGIVKFTKDWAKPEEVRAIPVAQNKDTYLKKFLANFLLILILLVTPKFQHGYIQ